MASAVGAIAFYLGLNKLLNSGPIKELKKRMDTLESSVGKKFEELTSQRTLDVDTLKAQMSKLEVAMASQVAHAEANKDLLEKIWDKLEKT